MTISRVEGADRVLTPAAVAFVEDLTRRFRPRIDELLARRRVTQERFNKGGRPDFLTDTADVRRGDWKVAPAPVDLQDRRVEITGPVDRKMIINALNSGAQVFMADFEDANSPTWANATLDDGRTVTRPLMEQLIAEELGRVREGVGAARFDRGDSRMRGPCSNRSRHRASWRISSRCPKSW